MDAAATARTLTQHNYDAGVVGYFTLLTAQRQYQTARLAQIQAVGQRLQDTVALYVALGGDWQSAAAERSSPTP